MGQMTLMGAGKATNGSSLLQGLKAYYKLEDATDALGNFNLADINGVTFVAGKVNNAANFASASSQELQHADAAGLRSGGPFSIACWVNLTTKTVDSPFVVKYQSGVNGTHEFLLWYYHATDTFRVNATVSGGATEDTINATNLGSPVTGTWYFLALTYDGTTLSLSVNNGTPNTVAHASQNAGTSPFELGHCDQVTAPGYLNGLVDEVGYWDHALTAAQITSLYNAGAGTTYPFTGVP